MGRSSSRTVMVTGTNRGLGKALVTAFAKEGADVIALSRHDDPEYLKFLADTAATYGVAIKPYKADLADPEGLNAALKKIASDHEKIDVLVNNAGIAYGAAFNMTPSSKLKEVFEVNFFAAVSIMQLISRKMLRQKSGAIVNIASTGGVEVNPGYLAYGASKAALIFASECLAKEVGAQGIRVNAVAPGLTDTKMGHYKSEDELKKVLNRTALGRMGRVDEIVSLVLYLASDEASFITGQCVRVDGGR